MTLFERYLAFVNAHPVAFHAAVGLVVTYVLVSLKRWPPPKDPRWAKAWALFVDVLIFTWDKYGGDLRLPLTGVSPPPEHVAKAEEAPPTPRNHGGA